MNLDVTPKFFKEARPKWSFSNLESILNSCAIPKMQKKKKNQKKHTPLILLIPSSVVNLQLDSIFVL